MTSSEPRRPPAVVVEGLRVERGGVAVLDGLSLEVRAGAVTGLVGPSGGGKSTLLRSLVGVQRVAGGRVEVLGAPAGSPSLRRRVGYLTQAPSVYSDLSVRENLAYFARLHHVAPARIDELIEAVALGGFEERVVGRLSGGQRARVSLATALLGEPDLLVLDEPTVGLDPLLRRDLWDFFHRLADGGATLIVSSHVMDEAERCDQLLLLRDGQLIADGTPDELRARTGEHGLDAVFLRLVEERG
jgi:ABC-2 type transport system ATP-binding protein